MKNRTRRRNVLRRHICPSTENGLRNGFKDSNISNSLSSRVVRKRLKEKTRDTASRWSYKISSKTLSTTYRKKPRTSNTTVNGLKIPII